VVRGGGVVEGEDDEFFRDRNGGAGGTGKQHGQQTREGGSGETHEGHAHTDNAGSGAFDPNRPARVEAAPDLRGDEPMI